MGSQTCIESDNLKHSSPFPVSPHNSEQRSCLSDRGECLQAGVNTFVEKPLSVRPVEEVQRLAKELKKAQDQNGAALAVGYMLRYSPAVEVKTTFLNRYVHTNATGG